MTRIDPIRALLLTLAWSLSGFTCVMVAMAMYRLIDDKLVASLFAGVFVVLDITKYLLWPGARDTARRGGVRLAALMVVCAVALSAGSGLATFDRLSSALLARGDAVAASAARQAALEAGVAESQAELSRLRAASAAVSEQAAQLRARGMATPALNLEVSEQARLDQQRAAVQARLDQQRAELTAAPSSRVVALPEALAFAIALGLALALEVVPAVVLAGFRSARVETHVEVAETPAVPAQVERVVAEPSPETGPETLETQPGADLPAEDARLLAELLSLAAASRAGDPVRLKEFARAHRIGNLRAANLFRTAAEVGALRKTSTCYVAA